MAQNPGAIRENDRERLNNADNARKVAWLLRGNEDIGVDDQDLVTELEWWYRWDFVTSYAYRQFEKIFGYEWLDSGLYYYTNAVRCRTPFNERPSDQMVENCREAFTLPLMSNRKAIVFVGGLSKVQALGSHGISMRAATLYNHKIYGLMMAIPHYRVWKGDDVVRYRAAIMRLTERIVDETSS